MPHRTWQPEEKQAIVLEGLRGLRSVVELCQFHEITTEQYYDWHDRFLEGGKCALALSQPASSAESQDVSVVQSLTQIEQALQAQTATLTQLTEALRTLQAEPSAVL